MRLHDSEEAAAELVEIAAQMRVDKTLSKSYLTMLKKPSYRKRLLLGCGTMTFNQFSGILVITSMFELPCLKTCSVRMTEILH